MYMYNLLASLGAHRFAKLLRVDHHLIVPTWTCSKSWTVHYLQLLRIHAQINPHKNVSINHLSRDKKNSRLR